MTKIILLILLTINTSRTFDNKGVVFNFYKKILVAEKFQYTQFVLPFPTEIPPIEKYIQNLTNRFEQKWNNKPIACDLFGTDMANTNLSAKWMMNEIYNEQSLLEKDIKALKGELHHLFPERPHLKREKRAVIAAVAGASAAAGILSLGIKKAMDEVCAFGIFGSCGTTVGDNEKAIKRAVQNMNYMTQEFEKVQNATEEKFYIVAAELHNLAKIQQEITDTQKNNAKLIEAEFKRIFKNMNKMTKCDQDLYNRQQALHDLTILTNLFNMIYTKFKVYRSTLYSYKSNVLAAQGAMANGFLPMTLISQKVLIKIITQLEADRAWTISDYLSLAIPLEHIAVYYETPLLRQVVTTDDGLVFELAIPYVSSRTVFNVFKAILLPMPIPNSKRAMVWNLESEYIAVSESKDATALLIKEDLEHCIGSRGYALCTRNFATETKAHSCIAQLFLNEPIDAAKACSMSDYELPKTETAQNIGQGRWLITSASSDFKFSEMSTNSSKYMETRKHPGCQTCIILLGCGRQLKSDNIQIKADLDSCRDQPAERVEMILPTPLEEIFSALPPIEELPHIPDEATARTILLENVQVELAKHPNTLTPNENTFKKLAEPIVANMKQLKPELTQRFEKTLSKTEYLAMAIISFIMSLLAHAFMTHIWGKYIHIHKRFPFVSKIHDRKVKSRPLALVSDEDYDFAAKHENHGIHNTTMLMSTRMLERIQNLTHSVNLMPVHENLPATAPNSMTLYPQIQREDQYALIQQPYPRTHSIQTINQQQHTNYT